MLNLKLHIKGFNTWIWPLRTDFCTGCSSSDCLDKMGRTHPFILKMPSHYINVGKNLSSWLDSGCPVIPEKKTKSVRKQKLKVTPNQIAPFVSTCPTHTHSHDSPLYFAPERSFGAKIKGRSSDKCSQKACFTTRYKCINSTACFAKWKRVGRKKAKRWEEMRGYERTIWKFYLKTENTEIHKRKKGGKMKMQK